MSYMVTNRLVKPVIMILILLCLWKRKDLIRKKIIVEITGKHLGEILVNINFWSVLFSEGNHLH